MSSFSLEQDRHCKGCVILVSCVTLQVKMMEADRSFHQATIKNTVESYLSCSFGKDCTDGPGSDSLVERFNLTAL